LLITTLVMAMVLCFSCSTLAAAITHEDANDPNKYKIDAAIADATTDTADLYIGTVKDWKAGGATGFAYADGRTTFFENGEAINPDDIIITNGKVGVVLAVGTRNPWGYPAGSVLDAGTVNNGKANRDTTWSIETLINDWDAWAPDNCGTVNFKLVKYNFDTKVIDETNGQAAVEVSRIYDIKGVKFDVVTYYGVDKDANYVKSFDYLKNTSGKELTSNAKDWTIGNSFYVTNKGDDGGAMFDLNANGAVNSAVGSYGIKNGPFSVSLIVPGENISSEKTKRTINSSYGAVGYKGMYAFHDWKDGESVTYDKYILITDKPSLGATNDFILNYNKTAKTTVTGTVKTADGTPVANAAVIVYTQKDDKDKAQVYTWVDTDASGNYTVNIPKNDKKIYSIKAEVEDFGPSAVAALANTEDTAKVDIVAGKAKDNLTINLKDQNGKPVWGKVEFLGEYPTVRYTGNSIFQANDQKGVIKAKVNDINKFKATVFGQGFYFYSNTVNITNADVKDGVIDVKIDMKYALPQNWLSGDLHHHADKNDAFADPKEAIPSMAASGLDVGFISDHDFTVNNDEGNKLSGHFGLKGFIPSEEISCSWAHFNVLPQTPQSYDYFMDNDKENHVMNQFAQMPVFVKQAHDNGATVTANHPNYSYGLFVAEAKEAVPGGYTDDYDNIEINACCRDQENMPTINTTLGLWDASVTGAKDATMDQATKKAHYLVAGSDTHDVLYPGVANNKGGTAVVTYATGKARTVVKVPEVKEQAQVNALENTTENPKSYALKENGLAFTQAAAAGQSYITMGPILDLSKAPGSKLGDGATPGEKIVYNEKFSVDIGIKSLSGIQDVVVLSNFGKDTYTYQGKDKKAAKPADYKLSHVYKVYHVDQLQGNENEASFTFSVDVPKGQSGYFAFMVVDKNDFHMYAITNPYWVTSKSAPFPDLEPNAWYVPYVEALSLDGIINGYEDGTFKPESDINRAEFAKMMAKWAPAATTKVEKTFPDVNTDDWFYKDVTYMATNGYLKGYEDNSFRPYAKITRAEIAQMIYNIKGFKATTKADIFTDVKAGEWYTDAVNTLAVEKYLAGYAEADGTFTFRPNNDATRAESAKFVYMAMNNGKVILNTVNE
ncbi:MAG: S-layer homology domain-containing protein, partial [Clostridiales bacterium]